MIFSNILLASVAAAGIVHVPLKARQVSEAPHVIEHLAERGFQHGTIAKGELFLEAEVEVGTPPQKVHMCFDTGSPHFWTLGSNSTQCQKEGGCEDSWDVSKSSTWKYENEGANWGSQGMWGRDIVSYAGASLANFKVYVSKTTSWYKVGIFGNSGSDDPEASFVGGLAKAGKISRAVFSINAEKPINWMDPKTAGVVSNVYYGGFDRAKYEGPLVTINCSHHNGYAMPFSGLSIEGEKVQLTRDHQIVLDTGGMRLQVTNGTMKQVSQKFGGDGVYQNGYWPVACDSKPSLTYEFGYTSIDVDLSMYIVPADHGICKLNGIQLMKDDDGVILMGAPLISRALVIYDNARDQITIARAKYTTDSDVVEITGDIPGAVLYKDWLAGKPLAGAASAAAAVLKSSSVAPKSSTLAVKTTSTLAIKTTSTQPQSQPTPTDDSSDDGDNQWCSLFGSFCFNW